MGLKIVCPGWKARAAAASSILLFVIVAAYISSTGFASAARENAPPNITSAHAEPTKVFVGDTMVITVEVEDPDGVKSVSAIMPHELGSDEVELALVRGTSTRGIWEAEWTAHDTAAKEYVTVVTAADAYGEESSAEIEWSDPTTVSSAALPNCGYGRCEQTFYSDGRFWAFYYDSTAAYIKYRSSADGVTWGSETSFRSADTRWDIHFDGTYVYIASCDGSDTDDVVFNRGNPNSDGSITWGGWYTAVDVGSYRAPYVSIGVNGNGYPIIAYELRTTESDKDVYVTKSSRNDGVWTTESGFPIKLVDYDRNAYPDVVGLTGDYFYVLWSNTDLYMYGALCSGTCGSVDTLVSGTSNACYDAVGVGYDVHLVEADSTSGIRYRERDWSGGWGSWTVLDAALGNFPQITKFGTTNFYVTWSDLGNKVYYRKYNGASWEAEVEWITESSIYGDYLGADYEALSAYLSVTFGTGASPYTLRHEFLNLDTSPPTTQNQGQNTSSVHTNGAANLYAQGLDTYGLDWAWLSTNESGSWRNETSRVLNMNDAVNTWTWSNFTWTNNSLADNTAVSWKIFYNDTRNNNVATSIMTFIYSDTSPPTWQNQGQNATTVAVNRSIYLYAQGKDTAALDMAWLSTNQSGSWENITCCGPGHTDNGDGTCTATLSDPIEDGVIDYYESAYTKMADDSYMDIRAESGRIRRAYVEWNISSIPQDALINTVWFQYHGYWSYSTKQCYIRDMASQPSASSAATIYSDAGAGYAYCINSTFPTISTGQTQVLDYGTPDNAVTDLQSALREREWFAIGIHLVTETSTKVADIYAEDYASADPKPTLKVFYRPTMCSVDMESASGVWRWSNFTWHNSTVPGNRVISWKIFYNDTAGNQVATNVANFDYGDMTAPTWQNQGQNATSIYVNQSINLSAQGRDAVALDWAWLSTNETGSWLNFSKRCLGHTDNGDGTCTATLADPTEDGVICYDCGDSGTYSRNTAVGIISGSYDRGFTYNEIERSYVEWDISSIPTDATINDVDFLYHGYYRYGDADCHLHDISSRPSTAADADAYADIANGAVYVDPAGFPVVAANQQVDLGTTADSDMQSALGVRQWFAIGLQIDNEASGTNAADIYSENSESAEPKPTLSIRYTPNPNKFYPNRTDSILDMNDIIDTWTWSNFTWRNGSISGCRSIGWRIFYNDTSGNEVATDINSFYICGTPSSGDCQMPGGFTCACSSTWYFPGNLHVRGTLDLLSGCNLVFTSTNQYIYTYSGGTLNINSGAGINKP